MPDQHSKKVKHIIFNYGDSRATDIYLNLKKLLGKIRQKRLLTKVRALGLNGKVLYCIPHILLGR